MRRLWWGIVVGLLVGCSSASITTPTAAVIGANQPKQLATVFMSPTPNDAERQATRLASTATPNIAPTITATPTVYIGLFLGNSGANPPQLDAASVGLAGAPTRTPVPSRCSLQPDTAILGVSWQTNPIVVRGLGCPIEGFLPFGGRSQVFENGVMYTRPTGTLWAIRTGDPGNYWMTESVDETAEGEFTPPAGLILPTGEFGAYWLANDDVRMDLGFALLPEANIPMGLQRFEGGTLLYDGDTGGVFVLLIDGAAYGPY